MKDESKRVIIWTDHGEAVDQELVCVIHNIYH